MPPLHRPLAALGVTGVFPLFNTMRGDFESLNHHIIQFGAPSFRNLRNGLRNLAMGLKPKSTRFPYPSAEADGNNKSIYFFTKLKALFFVFFFYSLQMTFV